MNMAHAVSEEELCDEFEMFGDKLDTPEIIEKCKAIDTYKIFHYLPLSGYKYFTNSYQQLLSRYIRSVYSKQQRSAHIILS